MVADHEQLWLEGFGELDGSREPWGGASPRVLTAAYKRFTLKAQAAKSASDSVDPEQYDLWRRMKKAPWVYQGAPLLLEMEGDHG